MTELDSLLASTQAIAEGWRRVNPQGKPGHEQVRKFNEQLEQLYQRGWDYVLGWRGELPDEFLPKRYLQRRAQVIHGLELELGEIAERYRKGTARSEAQQRAITEYQQAVEELFRIGHWEGSIDPDAQLPEDHMPEVYKDYWKKVMADFYASQKKP
jgi:hypothetical protein